MIQLLSLQEQQNIKPISENNVQKYDQLTKEVELLELQKLLGVALLQDIQTNPDTVANSALLNGASYEYKGTTITHKGLKFVIAYFNYSKYMGESYVNDTFTGFVKKKRDDSETLTEGEIKRLQNQYREIALNEWENIKCYLNSNHTLYPLWCESESKKVYSPKIYSIRKTFK